MTYHVYRCYDASDRLLYVGCTHNLTKRLNHHRNNGKTVASRVLRAVEPRIEIENYRDEPTAIRAESQAIRDEEPLLNIQGSSRPTWVMWIKVAQYLDLVGLPLSVAGLVRCLGCDNIGKEGRTNEVGRCRECAEFGDTVDIGGAA